MQLFILGPAFGLPSIDAEGIAAVALLQLHATEQYELIPTHDEERLPLPRLFDGTARVSGFHNIARHLVDKRIVAEPCRQLPRGQRADAAAITSLIDANAQTLLDISLYVGFENYRLATRPAFTRILPWHANYTLPPQRRSAARQRTHHLGISSIDVDNVHEDMSYRQPGVGKGVGEEPTFEAESQKRASLLLPRKHTVRSLLQRPEHAAVFKLHALADNFFEPLRDILGDGPYLLGAQEPTTVDCLVAGYLSLMLFPQLPQDWLASTMRRKYKTLVAYTNRMHQRLSLATNENAVLSLATCETTTAVVEQRRAHKLALPWNKAGGAETISQALVRIGIGLWNQLPILGDPHRLHLRNAKQHSFLTRNVQSLMLCIPSSAAAVVYLALHTGWIVWPHGAEVHHFGARRFSDLGHLGAALAGT